MLPAACALPPIDDLAGAINDVGIITLPDDGGKLIVSVFVNTLRRTTWRRERTIAEMTWLLFDFFAKEVTSRGSTLTVAPMSSCLTGR